MIGSLLEKDLVTPEYYPLTLNALVAACNQKHNREPVVSYDDATVEAALEGLRQEKLAAMITGAGLRVPKYRHLLGESLNLGRRELALICVLLLRGPQTTGELRDRTERMHEFADLEEIQGVLDRLIEQGLATRLARQPGTKEPRYAHLFAGEPAVPAVAAASDPAPRIDRIGALEAELSRLREEVETLKTQFAEFRRQFE